VKEVVGDQQQLQVSSITPTTQPAVPSVEPQSTLGIRQPGKNSLAAKLAKLGMAPAKDS
jgi:hypothetical protein